MKLFYMADEVLRKTVNNKNFKVEVSLASSFTSVIDSEGFCIFEAQKNLKNEEKIFFELDSTSYYSTYSKKEGYNCWIQKPYEERAITIDFNEFNKAQAEFIKKLK